MTLVDAQSGHLSAILDMNNAAVPAVNELTPETLQVLSQQACFFKVFTDGEEPLAFLLALPNGEDYDSLNYRWFSKRFDEFVYIDRVVVSPKAQGKGLGKALYEALAEASEGFARICCEVNVRPANTVSLAFHQALGFSEVGQQDTEQGKKRVSLLTRSLPNPA